MCERERERERETERDRQTETETEMDRQRDRESENTFKLTCTCTCIYDQPFSGLLPSYELLSLGIIKNALASLTEAELIRQPSSEFEGTGKHRLVQVVNQDKLVELAAQLGELTLCGHIVTNNNILPSLVAYRFCHL